MASSTALGRGGTHQVGVIRTHCNDPACVADDLTIDDLDMFNITHNWAGDSFAESVLRERLQERINGQRTDLRGHAEDIQKLYDWPNKWHLYVKVRSWTITNCRRFSYVDENGHVWIDWHLKQPLQPTTSDGKVQKPRLETDPAAYHGICSTAPAAIVSQNEVVVQMQHSTDSSSNKAVNDLPSGSVFDSIGNVEVDTNVPPNDSLRKDRQSMAVRKTYLNEFLCFLTKIKDDDPSHETHAENINIPKVEDDTTHKDYICDSKDLSTSISVQCSEMKRLLDALNHHQVWSDPQYTQFILNSMEIAHKKLASQCGNHSARLSGYCLRKGFLMGRNPDLAGLNLSDEEWNQLSEIIMLQLRTPDAK